MDNYRALYNDFHWNVPHEFNIADVCCTRWANTAPRNVAIIYDDNEVEIRLDYGAMHEKSNQLSNLLASLGVCMGTRVAIVLPQRPETAISHIACYQMGAIAMPMSVLYGSDALAYRLENSEALVAIIDESSIEKFKELRDTCNYPRHIITVNSDINNELSWERELSAHSSEFTPSKTLATDPAILIYTSGTTGPPKGALMPHSSILGNLPGFVASQNGYPKQDDVFWSPADWAWTGGLMDVLLPVLYLGQTLIACKARFSGELAFCILEKYGVTNTFMFPTALKKMKKACPDPSGKFNLKVRGIMSAGEAVGKDVFDWGKAAFGVTINEMFGQTEVNYVIGNSCEQWPAKPGSMGLPYPGHRVAIVDEEGRPVTNGEFGEIAVNRYDIHGHPDPVMFLEYWKEPGLTKKKFTGDWCLTGDIASVDEDGYIWYKGRSDDVFNSAGYRIGPFEIENCLNQHPYVAASAVVPKPDPERGNVVKAFVVLDPGINREQMSDTDLILSLQNHVRDKLAPYEYPKEIEFLNELPTTTTGKLQRAVLRRL